MTVVHKHELSASYILEYPLFEEEAFSVSLMNAFSERLVDEIKKLCSEPQFVQNGFKYRLAYKKVSDDGKCTVIFVTDLRKRGRTVKRKELETVWRNGYIESCRERTVL